MRNELSYFFAALRFFTRIPVPAWVGHDQAQLDCAARYFPAVGLLVGAAGAAVTVATLQVLPSSVAVLLGMLITILMTGAFHEDGLADAADGFGGGWEKEQVLTIMKDSRIGSYGTVALVVMLSLKYHAVQGLPWELMPFAIVAGHAGSRFASTVLIHVLEYVREDETSRSKPLARRIGRGELFVATLFGLLPFIFLPLENVLLAIALAALVTWLAARYFKRRIGGYTGDCLGATQQVTEVAIYLGLLCNFYW
jgi:adenosylcobinamide-GDP ribazoletransferase